MSNQDTRGFTRISPSAHVVIGAYLDQEYLRVLHLTVIASLFVAAQFGSVDNVMMMYATGALDHIPGKRTLIHLATSI